MFRTAAPVVAVTAALLLPATGGPGASATSAAPTAAPPVAAQATSEPLFSEPVYLPIRTPARVSCVKTNCFIPGRGYYHGDWAIDFVGELGDPIHAAGYGIVHIGGRESGCRESTSESRGNWVWIDHGGGEVTNYFHLSRILVSEGQHVTPDTRLGLMGSTGAAPPCRANYLHFERRITNQVSQRVEPEKMWACLKDRPVRYPDADGYSTWNMPKLEQWVQSDGTSCISRPARTGQPTLLRAKPTGGSSGIAVTWQAPATNPELVNGYRVYVSLWHPSTNEWDAPVYYTSPGQGTTFTVPNARYKRTYRVKVAARDGGGHSDWTDSQDVVMAKPPARPPITRLESTRSTVRGKWKIPHNGGNRITRYVATLSQGTTVVRTASLSPRIRETQWAGLRPRTRFTFTVVAVNQAGRGAAALRPVSTR